MTFVNLRMTRQLALEFGLLICTCGHPTNNHFDHAARPCAHCNCQGYQECGRRDIEILVESSPQRLAALIEVVRRAEALMLARDEDMHPKDDHAEKLNDAIDALWDVETVEETLSRQRADLAEKKLSNKLEK